MQHYNNPQCVDVEEFNDDLRKIKYIKRLFNQYHIEGTLKERLISRNQDGKLEVEKRLKAYDLDIKHWRDYDYVVTNENLENCFRQVEKIIQSHKSSNHPLS